MMDRSPRHSQQLKLQDEDSTTPDRQLLKNDITNISIFTSASEFVDVLSFFSLMSFTSALIDARERVQVDKDSIFVFKGVLPPFKKYTSVILSFPTFSLSISAPHDNSYSPKTTAHHGVVFTLSSLVSTVTGQYGPIITLLLFGSTNPFTFHLHQRVHSHIELHRTRSFLSLTVFHPFPAHSDPYQICSRRPFYELVNSRGLFSHFFSLTRTLCFILVCYLQRLSRVLDAFSPFRLTPFAVTGRPGSPNLKRTPTPSTTAPSMTPPPPH